MAEKLVYQFHDDFSGSVNGSWRLSSGSGYTLNGSDQVLRLVYNQTDYHKGGWTPQFNLGDKIVITTRLKFMQHDQPYWYPGITIVSGVLNTAAIDTHLSTPGISSGTGNGITYRHNRAQYDDGSYQNSYGDRIYGYPAGSTPLNPNISNYAGDNTWYNVQITVDFKSNTITSVTDKGTLTLTSANGVNLSTVGNTNGFVKLEIVGWWTTYIMDVDFFDLKVYKQDSGNVVFFDSL